MKCYGLKEIIRAKDNKLYNVERDKKNKLGWMNYSGRMRRKVSKSRLNCKL